MAHVGRGAAACLVMLLACAAVVQQVACLPAPSRLLEPGRSSRMGRIRASASSQDPVVHAVKEDQVPGIELAARQPLFNYATQQGLEILKAKITDLVIPDVVKTFNLPLVGEFTLQLSNIRLTQFNASSDEARLSILDGHFELWVTDVETQLTFNWHWEKLGMSGTGSGELNLGGGSIDLRFHVITSDTGKPQIVVDDANSHFSTVQLQIKSFSSDWLYQAVMALFNDQIQKAVQAGILSALQNDVPKSLNDVLGTLPTRLDIRGLPFSTSFQYSLFTLTYVMVKGYGEVETDSSGGDPSAPSLRALVPCPFAATPLPVSTDAIASDPHMTSIYLHESVANCMLWGLYQSKALKYDLQDGTIPKLHLTTDLLAMLIPQLPKQYPHQFLRITVDALAQPSVTFGAADGATLQAAYRTSIYVANETAGNPKIATLSANLTITAQVNYDTTVVTAVQAHHTVEDSSMPVSAAQWDNTVAWFVQNYAGLFPLSQLIDKFVQTPVTSLVSLVNAQASTYDGWYSLSGDVQMHDSR